MAEEKLVLRGTERYHMEKYLIDIGGVKVSDGVYQLQEAVVFLGEQRYVCVGSIRLSEVEVRFELERARERSIVEQFKMRFLTAGG